jgi:diguanylate cyclase (GGDEF)-like protein
MSLDIATLTLAGGIVALASGLFLISYWWHDRTATAALWWSAANCGLGLGVILLGLHAELPAALYRFVAPLLLEFCAALAWLAARVLNRGRIGNPIAVVGAVIALMLVPFALGATLDARSAGAVRQAISGLFYAAAALELWLGRGERLDGRAPMMGLLGLQAVALILAAIDRFGSNHLLPVPPLGWFGIIHFVGLIYAVGTTIFLTTMLKQRSEAGHKAAALTDPLTGLPNRRAFMERAAALVGQHAQSGAALSLLAFDLDRFKTINDRFGHPVGDAVLQVFAEVLTRNCRKTDLSARNGGEEFAALLPDCDVQTALARAARIRTDFQERARFLHATQLDATVSVGVATASDGLCVLGDLIACADKALYQAKASGRNRVVLGSLDGRPEDPANVIRIA